MYCIESCSTVFKFHLLEPPGPERPLPSDYWDRPPPHDFDHGNFHHQSYRTPPRPCPLFQGPVESYHRLPDQHYRDPENYQYMSPQVPVPEFVGGNNMGPLGPVVEAKTVSIDKILELPGRKERPSHVRIY